MNEIDNIVAQIREDVESHFGNSVITLPMINDLTEYLMGYQTAHGRVTNASYERRNNTMTITIAAETPISYITHTMISDVPIVYIEDGPITYA